MAAAAAAAAGSHLPPAPICSAAAMPGGKLTMGEGACREPINTAGPIPPGPAPIAGEMLPFGSGKPGGPPKCGGI